MEASNGRPIVMCTSWFRQKSQVPGLRIFSESLIPTGMIVAPVWMATMNPPFLNSPRAPVRDLVPSGAIQSTIPLFICSFAYSRSLIACAWSWRSMERNSAAFSPLPQIGTLNSSFFVSMRMLPGSEVKISGMS
ncbi:MAG: hypothetical protein BWZ01_02122 [Deltaproteobacteria bacterium ADurb.BinA179]|nr:MAG: hypothetical protein BWZ01_02122 [Deltaproteobacteria bacterium ADurb.BinA179]